LERLRSHKMLSRAVFWKPRLSSVMHQQERFSSPRSNTRLDQAKCRPASCVCVSDVQCIHFTLKILCQMLRRLTFNGISLGCQQSNLLRPVHALIFSSCSNGSVINGSLPPKLRGDDIAVQRQATCSTSREQLTSLRIHLEGVMILL